MRSRQYFATLPISVLFLVSFLSCAGTSKVQYSYLLKIKRVPRSVNQVEVFLTQRPTRTYSEMGILKYRAGTAEKYEDIVRYMRTKAAQVGADAIIMMDSSSGPSVPIGAVIVNLTDYRAMAIVYKN